MAVLRIILGDQLNLKTSSLSDTDLEGDIILISEVLDEITYVKHHKKKIAFIFSVMRHFALDLKNSGYNVKYTKLNDPKNTGSLRGEIERAILNLRPHKIVVTEPSDYRALKDVMGWQSAFDIPVEIRSDEKFLYSHKAFEEWARGRKHLRMEHFYRDVRRKFGILMKGTKPEGGQWNYDRENRKQPHQELKIPHTFMAKPDTITKEVIELVIEYFSDHFW